MCIRDRRELAAAAAAAAGAPVAGGAAAAEPALPRTPAHHCAHCGHENALGAHAGPGDARHEAQCVECGAALRGDGHVDYGAPRGVGDEAEAPRPSSLSLSGTSTTAR